MVDKSEKFSLLVRLGYIARGVVYVLLGYLAMSTAGKAKDGQSAVFDLIQDVPAGAAILYFVALGLLSYGAYKLIDAVTDLENHGSDAEGRAKRVGSAASGIAHLFLAYTSWQFAIGAKNQAADGATSTQEKVHSLLAWEVGPVLLGIGGLGLLAAAAVQAKKAWTAEFMRDVGGAPSYVKPVGRAGHAARAVVFLLIGWSVLKSAWLDKSSEVKGLGQAIVALSDNGVIYTLVAVGLIMFGAFSLVTARYRIIPDIQKGDLRPHL